MAKKSGKQNTEPVAHWTDPKSHPFQGELKFDLKFELLGLRFARPARIVYGFTPSWPYFDPKTGETRKGTECTVFQIEVCLVPGTWEDDGTGAGVFKEGEPYWTQMGDLTRDDMLPDDVENAILDAIEEQCRAENAKRRKAEGR